MTAESNAMSKEHEPDVQFEMALLSLRDRLREAVEQEKKVVADQNDYLFFRVGQYEQFPRPLATIALTTDYEQLLSGNSETLWLSLPVVDLDFQNPVAATEEDDAFFVIGFPDEDNSVKVDQETYQRFLEQRQDLSVTGLDHKLFTYQLVPITKIL